MEICGPPGGTIRTGVPVCVALADLRPKGPDRSSWPKAQGQPAQSGWPGPPGHGDSVGRAGDGMSLRLNGLQGKDPRTASRSLADRGSGTARANGPSIQDRQAHPSVHESAIAERSEGTILTRRAETSEAQALFMSSAAIAHKTSTAQPRKNQRPRPKNILGARTKMRGHMALLLEPVLQHEPVL